MQKIGVFFICLFVLGCNSNDEPTIKNKCNVSSEIISSEDFSAVSTSNYAITKVEIMLSHPNEVANESIYNPEFE